MPGPAYERVLRLLCLRPIAWWTRFCGIIRCGFLIICCAIGRRSPRACKREGKTARTETGSGPRRPYLPRFAPPAEAAMESTHYRAEPNGADAGPKRPRPTSVEQVLRQPGEGVVFAMSADRFLIRLSEYSLGSISTGIETPGAAPGPIEPTIRKKRFPNNGARYSDSLLQTRL